MTSSAVPLRVSLIISIRRLNLVLTYGIPPEFRDGVLCNYTVASSSAEEVVSSITVESRIFILASVPENVGQYVSK